MPLAVVRPRYRDPFSPLLLLSPGQLAVTGEQRELIKAVLDTACSDSKFAEKAYIALLLILTSSQTIAPKVTSLTPNSAEIGDPSFTLHVHGTNFKNTDKIVFAGVEEPTTFVSATELTTGVDMSVWVGPDVLPVLVESTDGVLSAPMSFTFTDGTPALAVKAAQQPVAEVVKK